MFTTKPFPSPIGEFVRSKILGYVIIKPVLYIALKTRHFVFQQPVCSGQFPWFAGLQTSRLLQANLPLQSLVKSLQVEEGVTTTHVTVTCQLEVSNPFLLYPYWSNHNAEMYKNQPDSPMPSNGSLHWTFFYISRKLLRDSELSSEVSIFFGAGVFFLSP